MQLKCSVYPLCCFFSINVLLKYNICIRKCTDVHWFLSFDEHTYDRHLLILYWNLFRSTNTCLMKPGALAMSTYVFAIVTSSCCLDYMMAFFCVMKCQQFYLKSALSDVSRATLDYFWFLFAWGYFPPLHLHSVRIIIVKCVSQMQSLHGFHFYHFYYC